jgi:hypothetical protein
MTAPVAEPVIVLKKSDRGAMASGGTVSFEIYVDGEWVGWVGDERRFTGVRLVRAAGGRAGARTATPLPGGAVRAIALGAAPSTP